MTFYVIYFFIFIYVYTNKILSFVLYMPTKTVISCFKTRDEFLQLLNNNPGLVIMKLGATWCGPCKKIQPMINQFFYSSPDNVICCDIDVDLSADLYTCLKSKRMVNGIPVVLAYYKDNNSFIPDDTITGANPEQLSLFFKRCQNYILSIT